MKPRDAYEWLKDDSIQTSYLGSMGELLAWDQRTFLPLRGQAHRAEQLAVLAKLLHERATNPRIGARLRDVEGSELMDKPNSPEAVNIREWRRNFDKSTKIPERLAVEIARATAEGETAWEKARVANDWKTFAPYLKRILELTKEKTQALGYPSEPYDALIDRYEPGETAASLEPIFEKMRQSLVALLEKVRGSRIRPDVSSLRRHYPTQAQESFSRTVAAALGYDFEAGRIDTTAHPFTIGLGPGDVRITSRYQENFFNTALFGTIHEAGHAMYEQGLPTEHWGTPMGEAVSLGIHESQSRLWENLVGRSRGFWRYVFPVARAQFDALSDVGFEEFLLAINAVNPSLIRVEADEVTYNLHILLRFELELAMMRDELSIDDLPGAWAEKMQKYLGVTPSDDASGAMQDVHWSAGLIGYFPTYTLGNIYAAQLYNEAEKELGDLEEAFARGEFGGLLSWLRANVHGLGSTFYPRDLIKRISGRDVSPEPFISYCESKYKQLYDLE